MTVLTAAEICTLARQIAKAPGYQTQSGQLLNLALEDLAQNFDFDVIKGTFTFSFTSGTKGPFTLPADWYRGIDEDIFYTIDGVPYPMVNIELTQLDLLVITSGLNDFPVYYATDMSQSPPVMYVWPPASGAYPVTARYFKASPTIVTPETSTSIPWFPSSNYLVTKVAGELMKITDDSRAVAFLGNEDPNKDTSGSATDLLRKYLRMKDDRGGKVNKVKLDRRSFGSNFTRLPNTKQIGW